MSDQQTVLLVEDEQMLLEMAGAALQKEFSTVRAQNGHSAMSYLHSHTPDAVVLDIILPDINGFDILETIRKDEKYNKTAVIMFTNLSEDTDKKRAQDLGADDYHVKADIDITDLPKIIRKAIEKRQG